MSESKSLAQDADGEYALYDIDNFEQLFISYRIEQIMDRSNPLPADKYLRAVWVQVTHIVDDDGDYKIESKQYQPVPCSDLFNLTNETERFKKQIANMMCADRGDDNIQLQGSDITLGGKQYYLMLLRCTDVPGLDYATECADDIDAQIYKFQVVSKVGTRFFTYKDYQDNGQELELVFQNTVTPLVSGSAIT